MAKQELKVEVEVGTGIEGGKYLCESEEVAEMIRAAYKRSVADFERVATELCKSGRAEFVD
jgi:hypothetical protein